MTPTKGRIAELWRYPVKSMAGERCEAMHVDARGVECDRCFAVRDAAGRFGSGKNTRRFRHMDGLLEFRSRYVGGTLEVVMPTNEVLRGVSANSDVALSALIGQPVTLAREAEISHLDAGPVHIVTTAALAWLQAALPTPRIDARRFRPNLVIDTLGIGQWEQGWIGRSLLTGTVQLEVTAPTERCVMVAFAQGDLTHEPAVLHHIKQNADLVFGVYAKVVRPGIIRQGDEVEIDG